MIKRAKGHGRYATFSVNLPELSQDWHVKLRPPSQKAKLVDEAERTMWIRGRLPSPERAFAFSLPGISMLVTKTLEGAPSYNYIDLLDPRTIVGGLSSAIQTLGHADTTGFPFSPPHWTTEKAAEANLKQLAISKTKHKELHPDFAKRTLEELKDIADAGACDDKSVLSHGDLCMPNVLLDNKGNMTGIVDLGGLHVGNSKLDLAIMSWTVQVNMGEEWASQLLDLHGSDTSDQGILYNRLAYDLGLERPNPWDWVHAPQLIEQRDRLSSQWGES